MLDSGSVIDLSYRDGHIRKGMSKQRCIRQAGTTHTFLMEAGITEVLQTACHVRNLRGFYREKYQTEVRAKIH